jgi:hypothetical protein
MGLPAFVNDRDLPLPEVEADHRRHAVVEQTITELKSAGLAHLPSGRFMANSAWLALTAMSHDLGRAVGQLGGPDLERATAATLRRKVFTCPAGSSPPVDAGTYGSLPAGPGPTRSCSP